MTNTVHISSFPPPILASGSYAIGATQMDILRSMVTVGYPSMRRAILEVGPWRATMMVAMTLGYLDGNLTREARLQS